MDKERLKKIFDNPDFIPGIHNYCDRWCERCPMTSRCGSYALEQEHFSGTKDKDIENKEFWDKLGDLFSTTIELLVEMIEEKGIDLTDIEPSTEDREKIKEASKENECVKMAKKYYKNVDSWFEESKAVLEQKEKILKQQLEMQLPKSDPVSESAKIKDVIDVIMWHHYQIYVKLRRAVTGKLEGVPEIIADMPKDYDGSAKVALVGIDRSIAAWGAMLQHFPEKENSILDILVLLEKLRKQTEAFFPDARAFVRPGFDD